jgi:hypothetical protein
MSLDEKKRKEIKNVVSILEQIGLEDIRLLSRDANTLLTRQEYIEGSKEECTGTTTEK